MNELRAYADGRWAEFHGLDACRLSMADAALGPRRADGLHGGVFGGEPAQFALYNGGEAARDVLTVWVQGDLVVGLEIRSPTPSAAAMDDLGPAEHEIDSELGAGWQQQLWPGRGLVLHRRGQRIAVALGLAPFSLASWASDPLRRWRVERRTDQIGGRPGS